mmetsp:Transcript_23354/g.59547  ORF Transcript_23354/g.59547 Transcript_23354/m.59547 type:complete len:125 (-) Transcript_23354:258-632(-)
MWNRPYVAQSQRANDFFIASQMGGPPLVAIRECAIGIVCPLRQAHNTASLASIRHNYVTSKASYKRVQRSDMPRETPVVMAESGKHAADRFNSNTVPATTHGIVPNWVSSNGAVAHICTAACTN